MSVEAGRQRREMREVNEPRQGAPATVAKPAALATGRRGNAPVPRRALLSDSAESPPGGSSRPLSEVTAPRRPPPC